MIRRRPRRVTHWQQSCRGLTGCVRLRIQRIRCLISCTFPVHTQVLVSTSWLFPTNWHQSEQRHPVHSSGDFFSWSSTKKQIFFLFRAPNCGTFWADWFGWDLHEVWDETLVNNERFNVSGQFESYGNQTEGKQQVKEQKSLQATVKGPDCCDGLLPVSSSHVWITPIICPFYSE